jgi:FeS assembly protein SufB
MTEQQTAPSTAEQLAVLGRYEYGWADADTAGANARRGLNEDVVRDISGKKNEPEWMLDLRLKGLRLFNRKPMPFWGADLSDIDFDNIKYFVRSTEKQAATWDDLPADIKNTYDRLGIPEAEKQRLIAGVAAQYECLASDTLVWTANRGQVYIKDVQPGDQVFSYDEAAERFVVAPVKAAAQTDTRLTYAVQTTRRTIRATDNHPMLVFRDERKAGRVRARYARRWVTVADLKPGDFIAVPRALPDSGAADELLPLMAGPDDLQTPPHGNDWLGFERVKAIEPYEIEPVYDIEVDGPHNFVAGGLVVHNSEVVYHAIREDLEAQGVLFLDTDTGLKEHEDIYREYFSTVIPAGDNKFAALNTAVWSGGSFIYVPKGVTVEIPLQAYFRINTENMGQFERTLIIVDEGAYVHYVEGCTAPIYSSDSLHSAVVEIIVKKGARCRYTTIQNWSNNVYNLVTKRAVAHEGATMEWIDGNIGSKVTMKYPSVYMTGEHAKGEVLSVAMAGEGQHQDAGAKMVHAAPHTSSTIISKSIARGGGRTSYRGLVQILDGSHHSRSTVKCDALLVDTISRSDTYPYVDIREDDVSMGHEATVSKVSEDQLFYLMSRGLTEDEAMAMIVRGFIEPIAKELPMEYALELNRLIELQMEGAVG